MENIEESLNSDEEGEDFGVSVRRRDRRNRRVRADRADGIVQRFNAPTDNNDMEKPDFQDSPVKITVLGSNDGNEIDENDL